MRPHEWNIFAGDPALAQDVSLQRDRFLSELGALLAGAMHHVAAPTAAEGLFRHHSKARWLRVTLELLHASLWCLLLSSSAVGGPSCHACTQPTFCCGRCRCISTW